MPITKIIFFRFMTSIGEHELKGPLFSLFKKWVFESLRPELQASIGLQGRFSLLEKWAFEKWVLKKWFFEFLRPEIRAPIGLQDCGFLVEYVWWFARDSRLTIHEGLNSLTLMRPLTLIEQSMRSWTLIEHHMRSKICCLIVLTFFLSLKLEISDRKAKIQEIKAKIRDKCYKGNCKAKIGITPIQVTSLRSALLRF